MKPKHQVLPFVLLALLLASLSLTGCASNPPKKEREEAEQAFLSAGLAERCATLTYQSGRQALDTARRLVSEKKYKEARHHFVVAKNLFEQARQEAEANPDCLKDADKTGGEDAGDGSRTVGSGMGAPGDPSNPESPNYELRMVHFPFNSDELTSQTTTMLERHARWMILHPQAQVRIEGHCDERGGMEYNLSLGERRAAAVKDFLVSRGVNPDSLTLISYGEERPLNPASTEEAWAQNRRAEFLKIWRQ